MAEISEETIAEFVSEAVLAVPGVRNLGWSGRSAADLTKNIISRGENRPRGIRISDSDDDDGMLIDIYIVVEFGAKIPEVAWTIQKSVAEGLKSSAQLRVKEINIHVSGVE